MTDAEFNALKNKVSSLETSIRKLEKQQKEWKKLGAKLKPKIRLFLTQLRNIADIKF